MRIQTNKLIEQKDINEIFKEIKQANDLVIEKFENIWPVAFLIKDNEIDSFDLTGNKKLVRIEFFKYLSNQKVKGYIIIMPGTFKGRNLVFRTLYTPSNIIKNIVYVENKKNIGERTIESRSKIVSDFWDLWGNFNTINGFRIKK